jgi:hypothetical protein
MHRRILTGSLKMVERKNEEPVRGRRVVSHWTGEDGNAVPVPPAEAAGVVVLGIEVIGLGPERGLLRTFGFLPDGCELPDGWHVVQGEQDLEIWHDHWGQYLEDSEADEAAEG